MYCKIHVKHNINAHGLESQMRVSKISNALDKNFQDFADKNYSLDECTTCRAMLWNIIAKNSKRPNE